VVPGNARFIITIVTISRTFCAPAFTRARGYQCACLLSNPYRCEMSRGAARE